MNKTIFRQYDTKWGSKPYPTKASNFENNGCGACSITHLLIEYDKYAKYTPEKVRKYIVDHNGCVCNQGTCWSAIPNTLKHYGFTVKEHDTLPETFAAIEKRKKKLGIILFSGGTKGGITWTGGGHYMAFVDYKVKDGKHYFYMKDSGPRKHDGWYCYETTMKGLICKIWSAYIKEETTPKLCGYTGTLPTRTLKKTNAEVKADAVAWAKLIAADNSFHYGHGDAAHHNGCYFCGTQPAVKIKSNIKDPYKTYCCNPFIGATWAHGGCVNQAAKLCKAGKSWSFKKGAGYDKSKLFDNIKKPKIAKLQPGDVMCKDNHVAMFVGDGKYVEATTTDDNKKNSEGWNNSIRVKTLSDTRYSQFKRIHRYNSAVNRTCDIEHGEYSERVKLWKLFLNWYFAKDVVKVDKFFDDDCLKYTKELQKKEKLTVNGKVNAKTLAKAKEIKK